MDELEAKLFEIDFLTFVIADENPTLSFDDAKKLALQEIKEIYEG